MIHNELRIGNLTSSEIVAVTTVDKTGKGFGKPALTYIEETNMERRLGRSLTDECNARPLVWGKLLEKRAFDLLGMEYILSSTVTDVHPIIPFWSGSKDGIKYDKGGTIIDIKCPLTLKSFCQLVDPLYRGHEEIHAMNMIRDNHKDGEKYYWQLVSNSIINGTEFAELVVYVPYFSELDDIKLLASRVPGEVASKHYWIAMAGDGELPFLKDGGYYKNINVLRFKVPESDKKLLTRKVLEAGKLLENVDGFAQIEYDPHAPGEVIYNDLKAV